MSTVVFVCVHNAGRSQMGRALFERAAAGRHRALSAGATPGDRVRPEVVAAIRELGIDLAERTSQLLTDELAGAGAHRAHDGLRRPMPVHPRQVLGAPRGTVLQPPTSGRHMRRSGTSALPRTGSRGKATATIA